ncbi:class A beta-lactamase [Lentzea sp. NPDC006480]|uniref:class A beta-lactamase n=1 Tax=Lentzea sp. NPDC006480 TaxID=3157176 RepID=UPI0033AFFEDA
MTARRTLLKSLALLPLAGCTTPTAIPPTGAPVTTVSGPVRHETLFELEKKYDARLGVFAAGVGTIEHRADERFAFCSTFKGLAAAAVLHRNPMAHLDTVVTYGSADLMKSSKITSQHVQTGMKLRDVCDAAVRYSDGTAGNLLLRDLGGPGELTRYLRELGDVETRMDRIEPDITSATPGDPRDTATPRSLGTDYQKLVLGDALEPEKRDFLKDLMIRNTTGANRIRAGLPKDWQVADKTGTGDHGTLNDIAIAWPPNRGPVLISIMSSKSAADAEYDEALIAEAAAYVAKTLI